MRKGKIKKILFWAVTIILLLLVAGTVLIRILFPPEKIKTILTGQLTEFLNREVRMEKISIGLFKGITVEGLKISQLSTFQEGTFISAKEFVVKYYLLALLKKKLVVSKIVLVEPQIALEQIGDGKFNFSDLMEKSSTEKEKNIEGKKQSKSVEDKKSDFSFLVSKVKISKGTVSFKDKFTNKFDTTIEEINLEVKNANLLTPFKVDLSFKGKVVLNKKELNGKVKFKSKVSLSNLELDKVKIDIEQLSFTSNQMGANLFGQVKNINNPLFDFSFSFNLNSIDKIKQLLDLSFPEGLVIKGESVLKGKVKGNLKDVFVESNLDFSGLELKYGNLFKKTRQMPANINFAVNFKETEEKKKQLKVNSAELLFSNLKLKSKGLINNLDNPYIDLDLDLQINSVDKIRDFLQLPFPKDFIFTGKSILKSKLKGTLKNIFIESMLDFSGVEMKYSNIFKKTQQVPAHIKLAVNYQETPRDKRQIKINSAEFLFSDFKLKMQKAIFNLDKQQLVGNLFTNQFNLQKFADISELIPKYKIKGIMGIKTDLSGDVKKLKFKGNFKLNNFQAEYKKNKITDFTADIDFSQQSINTKKFTAKMNGADFKINKLFVKNFKSPDISFEGSLSELDFDKIFFLFPPLPQGEKISKKEKKVVSSGTKKITGMKIKTRGKFKVGKIIHSNYRGNNIELKWTFGNLTADLGKLSGKAFVTMGKGKIYNLTALASKSKLLKALLSPVLLLQKLEKKGLVKNVDSLGGEISYNRIKGDYIFNRGIMTEESFVYTLSSDIFSKGKIDLVKEKLDLQMDVKLPKGKGKELAAYTEVDKDGRVILTFFIKGNYDNPKIKPKLKKAKEVIKQKVVEEIFKKIKIKGENGEEKPEDILKEKARDLLDNLWKKK